LRNAAADEAPLGIRFVRAQQRPRLILADEVSVVLGFSRPSTTQGQLADETWGDAA